MIRTDRIQISYKLEFITPFHCGTGIRSGLIDRSIMRDSEGYIYVPGSTIKGVVRELCEQLARFYEDSDDGMRVRMNSPHDKEAALKDLAAKPTLVARIFGSQIRPGQLYFSDARQSDDDKKRYDADNDLMRYQSMQTDLYTQVRLNRPTRTAVQGALYTSEFGISKMAFEGSIVGILKCMPINSETDKAFSGRENEPTYSLLLLLAGLYMIERLGGNKSAGKGECRCLVTQLKMNDTIFEPNDEGKLWENWLHHLNELSFYSYYSSMLEEEA